MGFIDKLSRFVDDVLLLPEEARGLAESAQALLDEGDPASALEAVSAALAIRSDHPQLLYLAGEALSRLDERDEAEKMFKEALDLEPDHAPSRVGLARLLRRAGDPSGAADQLRRAAPQLVGSGDKELAMVALQELARCHIELGRIDRAARELRKAVSLGPDDVLLHASLARLLGDLGTEEGAARAAARRAIDLVEGSKSGALLREVGAAALAVGLIDEASRVLALALEQGETVNLLLGRAALAQGDALKAHEHALRAVADEPGSAAPHRLRAELALRASDRSGALAALEAALTLEPRDEDALVLAMETAARVDLARAETHAKAVLAENPGHPRARAVMARARLARGEMEGATEALKALSVDTPELDEVWLGLAELAIKEGRGESALSALERVEAVSPGHPELGSLGAEACRLVASGGSGVEPDLFDVLERVHALLAGQPELSELSVEIGRIREDYDKPLLLTVMGEFNAGKSTFINALIGEPVAPMGITPTTATINVLKYGPTRMVRVLHREGTVKELQYDALGAWLKGLSREAAVEVRQVEILYPAEELTRVNLVDTPGFNSIVPEHERVARQFIERADAVVWLFDAGQPGKESERAALAKISAQGKRVLGVLNKSDRLAPEALEKVIRHLTGDGDDDSESDGDGLAQILEAIVPLSARVALVAKQQEQGDAEEALAQSGLPLLQEQLETRFYSQARRIKRAGCAARLVAVLERAVAHETAANAEVRQGAAMIEEARSALTSLPDGLVDASAGLVSHELESLRRAVAAEAAREILEFIRPRRHLLDSHRFSPEDRQYLIELIEERMTSAMERLKDSLAQQAVSTIGELWAELRATEGALLSFAPDGSREGNEFGRMVGWALLAFYRGLVRGGRADRFFDEELPRIELSEETLSRRIASWWEGSEDLVRDEIRQGAEELMRRMDALLVSEAGRLRAELARRRRAGVRPLVGFTTLAREWAGVP